MAAEHAHAAGEVCASAGGARTTRLTKTVSVPLNFMRWLVVGCVGFAALGFVLPFSPIPPCPLLSITGVPCPLCGMTRSARSIMQFDGVGALRYQPFGVLATIVGAVILVMWAIPRTRSVSSVRIPLAVVVVAFIASWVWNIGFNPTFN